MLSRTRFSVHCWLVPVLAVHCWIFALFAVDPLTTSRRRLLPALVRRRTPSAGFVVPVQVPAVTSRFQEFCQPTDMVSPLIVSGSQTSGEDPRSEGTQRSP